MNTSSLKSGLEPNGLDDRAAASATGSNPSFTPGPWTIVPRNVEEDGSVFSAHIIGGPRDLFVVPLETDYAARRVVEEPRSLFQWSERNHADAHLIAAAPDLLEACQNMRGLYDGPIERRRREGDPLYAEAIDQLRAAISRALNLPTDGGVTDE